MSNQAAETQRDAYVSPYMTASEVCRHLHISPASYYRWIKDGILPRPVRLGPQVKRQLREEIEQFERSRRDARV